MTLTFTDQEVQIIVNAIAKEPWHIANPLLISLDKQVRDYQANLPTAQQVVDQKTKGV